MRRYWLTGGRSSLAIFITVLAMSASAQTPQPEAPAELDIPPELAPAPAAEPAAPTPQTTDVTAPVTVATPAETKPAASAAPQTPAPNTPAQKSAPKPPALASATPLLRYGDADSLSLQLTGSFRASFLGMQGFATDRDLTLVAPAPFETRVRVAPEIRYARGGLIGEFDFVTGALSGLPAQELRLGQSAHPTLSMADLRQLYAEYRAPTFVLRAGQQASNWGLGIVANNGSHDASPGDFGDARYGDLTWRAAIAGRPLYGLGGMFRAIEPILAADMVVRDDTANWYQGDRALQGVFALRFNIDADRNFGVYTVYRQQRLEGATDGARSTDAVVVDLAGKWKWTNERNDMETRLGGELAWITGTTTMARADTAPVLQLEQFGAAFKASVRVKAWEGLVDFGYASGDQNPYDDRLQSFRFDPDYHAGLILYEEVMGWQTARTYARASDPDLIGVPPEGVDLLPTRGAVAGSTYVFPRVRHAVREWLDVYGGPLFAFSTASMADPFNTRVDGGSPTNALGGRPGNFLGTELDVGVQVRTSPVRGMAVSATAEAGYFIPGSAFNDAAGAPMSPIAAGRIRGAVHF